MNVQEIRHAITTTLQRFCWVYRTTNFSIASIRDFVSVEPRIECSLASITVDNYERVRDFREAGRVREYRDKISSGQVGLFAEQRGEAIGSIWASINYEPRPAILKMPIELQPNTALIHDVVTSPKCRGLGIGPFMVSGMASLLLNRHRVIEIVIDVSSSNRPSLRMIEKMGLRAERRMLYVSILTKLAVQKSLDAMPSQCQA